MKPEQFIRATLILLVAAVICFALVPVYTVRPIEIVEVVNQVTVVPTPTPKPSPSPSPTPQPQTQTAAGQVVYYWETVPAEEEEGPQEVLVEKSININTATVEELDLLPGIGPVLAQRIVDYREQNNGFYDTYELVEVSGIGDKTYAKLEPYVYV